MEEKEGTRVLSRSPVRVSRRHLCAVGGRFCEASSGNEKGPSMLSTEPPWAPHPSLSCRMHGHIIWRRRGEKKKSVFKLPLNILKGGIIGPRKGRWDERQSLHWASTWGEGEGSILYTGLPSLRSHHALRAGGTLSQDLGDGPRTAGVCVCEDSHHNSQQRRFSTGILDFFFSSHHL